MYKAPASASCIKIILVSTTELELTRLERVRLSGGGRGNQGLIDAMLLRRSTLTCEDHGDVMVWAVTSEDGDTRITFDS